MAAVRSVHIVYFSGTGGTARVARHLADALERRRVAVTVAALENGAGSTAAPAKADQLVILYPVYAAVAPQPVHEWIAAAPRGKGLKTAVLSVSGGGEVSPNTACRVSVIRRLMHKGYDVTYERMLVMPSNCILGYGEQLSALLLSEAPRKARSIADDLLAGRVRRTKPFVQDRVVSRLASVEHIGSRFFGRRLKANDDCTGCGLCAERCPRGNIEMRNGRPVFGSRCVVCLRCVYGCPQQAVVPGLLKGMVLKEGFDLDALDRRLAQIEVTGSIEALTPGKALRGVRAYLLEP